jgi:hypothetical protein
LGFLVVVVDGILYDAGAASPLLARWAIKAAVPTATAPAVAHFVTDELSNSASIFYVECSLCFSTLMFNLTNWMSLWVRFFKGAGFSPSLKSRGPRFLGQRDHRGRRGTFAIIGIMYILNVHSIPYDCMSGTNTWSEFMNLYMLK